MRLHRVLLASVFLLASAILRADALDDIVKKEMETEHISGIAVGIVKDGKLIEKRGYGLANRETCTPVTPDTVFRIASMSKEFCSAAVLMLVDEGKVKLDEPVNTYLPEVPKEWEKITVRQCLNHTSGIPDITDTKWDIKKDYSESEFFELFQGVPLEFRPGEKYKYSNFGYSTMGILVHRVSGETLWDYVEEHIFKPAGLTNTYYYKPNLDLSKFALGYNYKDGVFTPAVAERPMIYSGSGGVMSSIEDFAKWDAVLWGDSIIKPSVKALWWKKGILNDGKETAYGMGWMLSDRNGRKTVHHTGGTYGFTSMISRYLDEHLTVIVFRNAYVDDVRDFCDAIAKLYLQPKAEKKAA